MVCQRRATERISIEPGSYSRLQKYAREKFSVSVSELGRVVLDAYLAHAERFYRGKERTLTTMTTDPATRPIDAVIFDMDGVLCDSELASRDTAVAVLSEMYALQDVKAEDFANFTGMGEGRFLGGVAEMYGVKDFDEAAAKDKFFRKYLTSGFLKSVKAYPGVKGLIQRCRELGLKVGVASAADRIKVRANLKAVGLDEDGLFDFITSSDDIVNKKPAPDVFLAAARGLEVDPTRCTVVEDAVAGVQAAKAAGMRCVAVATSLSESSLEEAGADVIRGEPAFISVEDLFGAPLSQETDPSPANATSET